VEGDACGHCVQCVAVKQQTSNSVIEIDAASNGGVEEVRRIKDMVLYGHDGEWRVVILDEAHSMSNAAYHALLKLLEEPPPRTVFVLVTTEPDKILGTVRSRAMPFEFRRIRTADVEARLRTIAAAEGLAGDDSLFSEIARYAQGGLRDAVMLLDQVSRVEGVTTGEDFRDFFGVKDYSLPMLWAALRGDHAEGYRLVAENFSRTGEAAGMVADLSRLVSDLLVIKSQGRPDYPEEALAERAELAQAVSAEALVQVIEILWELRSRTRTTENDHRSSMEMGFALIARLLQPSVPAEEPTRAPILPTGDPQAMSLADIRSFSAGR
jgi:DNA polymerase-3 subunit gamma/tau